MPNKKTSLRKTTKEIISEKAFQLFKQYGYNNVSVRKLASELDMTTGALYYHYKNKADILTDRAELNEKQILSKVSNPPYKSEKENILSLFTDLMADMIEFEGTELCMIRMFGNELAKNRSNALESSLKLMITKALSNNEFSSDYTTQEILDSILFTYRGIEYSWATSQKAINLKDTLLTELNKVITFYSVRD